MTNRVIISGSGAAAGVPVPVKGWGECNPYNAKNVRRRSGILVQMDNTNIQVDTSQDFRCQILDNAIKNLDAVLYTHAHADHISGIDDLRSFTKFNKKSLNIYATAEHIAEIKRRFGYVFTDVKMKEITQRPQLVENIVEYYVPLKVEKTEIIPIAFEEHSVPTCGYIFDGGKLVIIPDYRRIPERTLEYLQKIDVDVMIMPLTEIGEQAYHADININKKYIDIIRPQRVIFTHLSEYCDYDEVMKISPHNAVPAYDNMMIEL